MNGAIPAELYNLCVGKFERTWRGKNGELNCPQKEQCCHYHPRLECLTAAEPTFVGPSLVIPSDVKCVLTVIQKMHVLQTFGINLF